MSNSKETPDERQTNAKKARSRCGLSIHPEETGAAFILPFHPYSCIGARIVIRSAFLHIKQESDGWYSTAAISHLLFATLALSDLSM